MPPPMPRSPARKPIAAPSSKYRAISDASTARSRLLLHEPQHERPFRRIDRHDRKPVPSLQYAHALELRMQAKLGERHQPRLLDELYVDVDPAGRIADRFRIE